jgi:hypothetical protein
MASSPSCSASPLGLLAVATKATTRIRVRIISPTVAVVGNESDEESGLPEAI